MKKSSRLRMRGLTALLLCAAMMFGLFGCAGNADGTAGNDDTPEVAYVAEFLEVEGATDIVSLKEIDGILYMVTVEYSEVTEYSLMTLNLEDKTTTKVSLESNGGYFTVIMNDDGSLEAIENISEYDEEWNLISQTILLNTYNAAGELVSSESINEKLGLAEEFYISIFLKDKDGNYLIGNWGQPMMIYSPQFEKLGEISGSEQIDSFLITENGSVVGSRWGNMGQEFIPVDMATKTTGTAIESNKSSGSSTAWSGAGDSVLYMNGTSLWSCDILTGETTEIFDCVDMDVNGEYVQQVYAMEDDKYLLMYYDYMSNESGLMIATPVDPSTIVERTELTIATIYPDSGINDKVIKFNQTNTEYRIKVVDYSTEDYDFEAALTNLQNDIAAGNVPDMIDVSASNVPWRNWVSKGILTDLYPLMEADGEFAKEDLMDNVRNAVEMDGSLYIMPSKFGLNCVMAKADNVNGITLLTPEVLLQMEQSLPADTELFYWNDRSTAMNNLVYQCMDSYVDYEKGECYFDTDEFKAVLEYAKAQPAEFQYEEGVSVPGLLQTDKVIFYDFYMSQMADYQFHKEIFGGEITCLGFSGSDEDGIKINLSGTALAITENCEHKDVAWQFVKSFLATDEEPGMSWGIPVTKDGFESFIYDAQHMEDTHSYGWDDINIDITSATDQDVAELRTLLEKADTLTYMDLSLIAIIEEEVGPYFEGQKSADEVADIIQSRIDIYLKENL